MMRKNLISMTLLSIMLVGTAITPLVNASDTSSYFRDRSLDTPDMYSITKKDQTIIDMAVGKMEKWITKHGEDNRDWLIIQLGNARDARIGNARIYSIINATIAKLKSTGEVNVAIARKNNKADWVCGEDIHYDGYSYSTKSLPDGNCWTTSYMKHIPFQGNAWNYGNPTPNVPIDENGKKYGFLYSWYAARGSLETYVEDANEEKNGVCKVLGKGWQLPYREDFERLGDVKGTGWNGNAMFGVFSELSGRYNFLDKFSFDGINSSTYVWSPRRAVLFENSDDQMTTSIKDETIDRSEDPDRFSLVYTEPSAYKISGASVVCVNKTEKESLVSCKIDEHKESGICMPNSKSCTIQNGVGKQAWSNGSWGNCSIATCDLGYTKQGNSCAKSGTKQKVWSCGQNVTYDGFSYSTKQLSDGKCWTQGNMKHLPGVGDSWNYGDTTSNLPTNDVGNNSGRLYTWYATLGMGEDGKKVEKNVCEVLGEGWNLPSSIMPEQRDSRIVINYGWNGTKLNGRVTQLGGFRRDNGGYSSIGEFGAWRDKDGEIYYMLGNGLQTYHIGRSQVGDNKLSGLSVICVKN